MGFLDKLRNYLRKPVEDNLQRAEMLSSGSALFTPFSGDAYSNDIYRSAVDAIARNTAKLKGRHIIYSKQDSERFEGDQYLNRVLQVRPNAYMSAYDLIYKLTTHYFLYNNCFAYLQKSDKGNLQAIFPLSPANVEYLTDPSGEMYCRFLFRNGQQFTLPFKDVLVLRRHFNSNDLLGDTNTAITPALDLAHMQSEGLQSAIKSGATIRGLLKYQQVMSPEKLKEEKEQFEKDYLSATNNGGIAALDTKMDYQPLESNPVSIDDKQMDAVKNKIYDYLGVSENIVNSTYSEQEWNSFFSSVIEPLGLQLGLELTEKVFTPREQTFGNSIIFESNRLAYASNESKTNMLKELLPMGLLTQNQALEILGLPPVEGGNKRLQSLNFVNQDKADEYQNVGGNGNEGSTTPANKSATE